MDQELRDGDLGQGEEPLLTLTNTMRPGIGAMMRSPLFCAVGVYANAPIRSKRLIDWCHGRAFAPTSRRWC